MTDKEDEFAFEESKAGAKFTRNQSMNAFLEFENLDIDRNMSLVKFYEVAEDLLLSLQYFNLRHKAEAAIKRLNTIGKTMLYMRIEMNNFETDKMCIIWLDRPNEIVLNWTHSYCTEWINEWKQFHKSWPLWRNSVSEESQFNEFQDNLRESNKFELIDIQKNSSQEIEMDNIMKKKLKDCIKYFESL